MKNNIDLAPSIFQREIKQKANAKTYEVAHRFLKRTIQFSVLPESHVRGIALLTDYLARIFNVQKDEVAFLVLDRFGEDLHFVAPDYLAKIKANFPFDRCRSLAGKALWDQKPYIENGVSHVNHLSFFEQVKRGNPRLAKIERMLTFPILAGESPVGVVQISRKALKAGLALPSFGLSDIQHLKSIERLILQLFQGIRSSFKKSDSKQVTRQNLYA